MSLHETATVCPVFAMQHPATFRVFVKTRPRVWFRRGRTPRNDVLGSNDGTKHALGAPRRRRRRRKKDYD